MSRSNEEQRYGAEHARMERKYFYGHFMVFILAHMVFIFMFGLVPASELSSGSYLTHIKDWVLTKEKGFYIDETANSISRVWTTAIVVHAIWAFSYVFFPKKAPKNKDNNVQRASRITKVKNKPTKKEKIPEGRAWLYLFISGLVEIYWATGLKANSLSLLTLVAIILSFDLLIRATKTIPIGTSYAVFTGIGTIGTILVDLIIFNEPLKMIKILLILLLAVFIIGLKFTGDTPKEVN